MTVVFPAQGDVGPQGEKGVKGEKGAPIPGPPGRKVMYPYSMYIYVRYLTYHRGILDLVEILAVVLMT